MARGNPLGYVRRGEIQGGCDQEPGAALRPAAIQGLSARGIQFSRGCPFTCEFCDIIELYGRRASDENGEQVIAELDRLYALGYRGHVDFVDDNLIGNKKAVKAFLPHLTKWQEAHGFPFEFSTEASVNLADDSDLLKMLRDANFFAVFIGIESPIRKRWSDAKEAEHPS